MKLNLGAGPVRIPGEIGVDAHPTSGADVICDLCTLPYPDNSVEFVRMEHVLEHLPLKRAVPALLEAYRVLEPGGEIRVGVPDLAGMCYAYLASNTLADKVQATRWLYGGQTHEGEYHRSGWDAETLGDMMRVVGFGGVIVEHDEGRDEGVNLIALAVKP